MYWKIGCNEPLQVCVEKGTSQEPQGELSFEAQERLEDFMKKGPEKRPPEKTCFLSLT